MRNLKRRTKRDKKNFSIAIKCWLHHTKGIRNGTAKPRKQNKKFAAEMRACQKLIRRRHYRRAAQRLKQAVPL